MRLSRLVLKRVGIHRIEAQAAGAGERAQFRRIVRLVPGNVERHGRSRADQFENRPAVFKLLVNITRLALAGETRESCSARADTPRGNRDVKGCGLLYQILDIDVLPPEFPGESFVVFVNPRARLTILVVDE